jgi:1-acyl-sn-glycerol-3-phosphate acyltransferase
MLRRLARAWLRLTGWRLYGTPPAEPKFVLIAQHSTNWDGWFLLLFALAFGVKLNWVGKDSLFKGPLGWIARGLGGFAVDRSASHDLVSQLAGEFGKRERLGLVIAPEGTRKRAEHWRSGFLHIARAAHVPIYLAMLDYRRKLGGFGPGVMPEGGSRAVMDEIRAFYAGATPCYPDACGPIRLKEEA